jgi:CRP/FNR family cyclic AMP-dependent transcriptional regulator
MRFPSGNNSDAMVFEPLLFVATEGGGRTISRYRSNKLIVVQGDPADGVFYVLRGKVKVTFLSGSGKEAVLAIHGEGDFFGQNCLITSARRRYSASAITECTIMRIENAVLQEVLQKHPEFSEFFIACLLRRAILMQDDIIDHLTNSSQKRLARLLLLLSCDWDNRTETISPHISDELLAQMVGTTRSRVNAFMNEFRRSGLIDYNADGELRVHRTLEQVLLHD